jgi:hypothetical protein
VVPVAVPTESEETAMDVLCCVLVQVRDVMGQQLPLCELARFLNS